MVNILKKLYEAFIKKPPSERIKILRKHNNLTIKEAAERSITTEKCWSNWENGKTVPRDKNKKIIAAVLGVNVETIFETPKNFKELIIIECPNQHSCDIR